MMFADAMVAAAAFVVAYLLRDKIQDIYPLEAYLKLLPFFILIWVGFFTALGMYNSFRIKPISDVISIIFETSMFGFVIFGSVLYVLKLHEISRALVFMIFASAVIFFIVEKVALVKSFRFVRKRGYNTRNILIVGTNRRALQFAEVVERHSEWGFRVLGFLDEDPKRKGEEVDKHKVIGAFSDLVSILHNKVVDHVVFVVPRMWFEKIEDLIRICETEGIPASVTVDIYEQKISRAKQSDFHGIPLLTFESAPTNEWQLAAKRIFDLTFSLIFLILFSPVFLFIAAAIKMTSTGPVLFRQERCGLNGRRFMFYKFRTMVDRAEEKLGDLLGCNEMGGPVFKMKNDPRMTPVGKFLRRFSLDELPQLWNIFLGQMSFVGPRPPIPREVNKYDNWQRRRLSMKPGLTCLWQISGRNEIKNFEQWMKLDLKYIDNWSLWLDLIIFFKTIPVVLLAKGAK